MLNAAKKLGLINPITGDGLPTLAMMTECVSDAENDARVITAHPAPAESCKLVAAHTGDGWILEIHDAADETIGFLAWPQSWPVSVTTEQLEAFGFAVV